MLVSPKIVIKMNEIKVPIVINEEKLSTGKKIFVAHCDVLNVSSQGKTFEEVKKNIEEARNIEVEECPDKLDLIIQEAQPVITFVDVIKDAKTSSAIRKAAC